MEAANLNEEMELVQEKEVLRTYELRPLRYFEELLVIKGQFDGPWWLWVKRMWSNTRNLTNLLLNEFDFAYNHNSNSIISVFGTWGIGKSILALSIAKHLQNRILEIHDIAAQIDISFSLAETFREIHKMQKGWIRIQDEDPRLSGEGTKTVKDAIYNIQSNALRANLNSFLIDSKEPPGAHSANIVLCPFGIDYNQKVTRVKIFSAYTLRPLGWAEIPKLDDPALEMRYDDLKKDHVRRTIQTKGLASVRYDKERLRKDAKLLLDETKQEFGNIELQKTFLDLMVPFAGVLGNTNYQKSVAKYAWIQVLKKRAGLSSSIQTKPKPKVSLDHITFNEGLFPAFIQAMQQFIKFSMPQIAKSKFNVPSECSEIYQLYLEGLDPESIRKSLGLKGSKATTSRRLQRLNKFIHEPKNSEKIGKLYEDVFCEYYRQMGHDVLQEGGSIPGGIDSLVDGQVWSLKCYHDDVNKSLKIYFRDISKGEKAYAKDHNPILGISLLNPFWGVESRIKIDIVDFEKQGEVVFVKPI